MSQILILYQKNKMYFCIIYENVFSGGFLIKNATDCFPYSSSSFPTYFLNFQTLSTYFQISTLRIQSIKIFNIKFTFNKFLISLYIWYKISTCICKNWILDYIIDSLVSLFNWTTYLIDSIINNAFEKVKFPCISAIIVF